MGVPGKTQGSIFFNVPCEVCSYSAGRVAGILVCVSNYVGVCVSKEDGFC